MLCCPASTDILPSPLPLSPCDKCQGVHLRIPTRLHITGTLLWMTLPWGQVCPLRVALCDVLLGQ